MDTSPTRPLSLTLSGGGFRATLFHLGLIRLLHDTGLLSQVHRIGAVSGGSIMAAHLVLNWTKYSGTDAEFEEASRDIVAFIGRDIRGRIVRRWLLAWMLILPRILVNLWRRWTFTNLLQRDLASLYRRATLADLAPKDDVKRPRTFFYTTSLSTGEVCWFDYKGFTWRDKDGEHPIAAPMTPVAFAVAASSAFPPLFPPIVVSHDVLSCDKEQFQNPQYLTDGGVYDNLGIDRLNEYDRAKGGTDLFIVSDAEGNFDWDFAHSYKMIISRNIRASDLLMKRVSKLEYAALGSIRERLVIVDIDTELPDAFLPAEVQRQLRNVRTDLDKFSRTEIAALVRHGYDVARRALVEKGLVPSPLVTTPSGPPAPPGKGDSWLKKVKRARVRRYRLWSFRDWASWATLGMALVIGGTVGLKQYRIVTRARSVRAAENAARAATKRADSVESLNQRLNPFAVDFYRHRHRPIEPGTSIGVSSESGPSSAATICCVVRARNEPGKRFLLTTAATPGRRVAVGDVLYQPAPLDGAHMPGDEVARVSKVVPLPGMQAGFAVAAIAEMLPGIAINNHVSGFGPLNGVGLLRRGQQVLIAGRTTGIAKVIVTGLGETIEVAKPGEGGTVVVPGLIRLSVDGGVPARGGDGGAPVLMPNGQVAGMVLVGDSESSWAVPIRTLLDAFATDIDPPPR